MDADDVVSVSFAPLGRSAATIGTLPEVVVMAVVLLAVAAVSRRGGDSAKPNLDPPPMRDL